MTLLPTIVFAVIAGLLIGSFLTVVVDRVPRRASIVAPGSACGMCGTRLGPLDLVPVVSWVVLRGRCRHCGGRIGPEAPLLELATTAAFAGFAWHFGFTWELGAFCVLAAGLVALTAIDLRIHRLPREITYTTFALGAPLLIVAAVVRHEPHRIVLALFGAAISFVIMLLVYLASRGGMGDGDVRLAPLLGLYLGWINPGIAPVGLLFGFFAGALVGVAMMAIGSAGRRTAVPFGPFLALGTIAAVFAGQRFVDLLWSRG